LAQPRVTLSDLEWSYHASRAISAVEFVVVVMTTAMSSVCNRLKRKCRRWQSE